MEEHGIVHREVFAEVPPRVVYTATKLGLSLRAIVGALCDWGRRHAGELNALEERSGASPARALRAARRSAGAPRLDEREASEPTPISAHLSR